MKCWKAITRILLCCLVGKAFAAPMQTARELAAVNRGDPCSETNFALTATLTRSIIPLVNSILVVDETGATSLILDDRLCQTPLSIGDLLDLRGDVSYLDDGCVRLTVRQATVLGHGVPPPVAETDIPGAMSGAYDFRLVRVTATVQDAFVDEIDPRFFFIVLQHDGETLYAATRRGTSRFCSHQNELIGAIVTVTGCCDAYRAKNRRYKGRSLDLASDDDIVILRPATSNAYDVPDISVLREVTPDKMHACGRHKACGRILVAWHGDTFLIKTAGKEIVRVETATESLPSAGDSVEAVGFPETDVYNINLIRAQWRRIPPTDVLSATDGPVPRISARILFSDDRNRTKMNTERHGQLVRMEGIVRALPGIENDGILYLESGGYLIAIDLSACPDTSSGVEVGSRITLTGVCVMKVDRFRPNAALPRVRGFTIVLRETDRITVLARPSWWTPFRIWTAFGLLIATLLAVFVWNASLRRLAERRGRELLRRQIQSVKSKLQVDERTRLAIELHDSLSQTLTGVSMEIAAADDLKGDASAEMATHLARAGRILKSCRDELRNCLWDLRSEALDEPDMTQAVLRTLQPHIDSPQLSVRFNLPHARISDNTAHALLRMIRELVVNALRHGHATSVKVAGSMDHGSLNFSVRDDGCGFDPDDCPGVMQEHFGLQGIRERLERLGGTLTVESRPGHGTRISGRIPTHTLSAEGI